MKSKFLESIMSGLSPEQKDQLGEKLEMLLEKILEWAESAGYTPEEIKRLGGGFVNPVIEIFTTTGESFIVKHIQSDYDLKGVKFAQQTVNSISNEDEQFIPKIIGWLDEVTIISEKAKGLPARQYLENASKSPEDLEIAREAFYTLGASLGKIHERTEMSYEEIDPDKDYRKDKVKLINHAKDLVNTGKLNINDKEIELLESVAEDTLQEGFVSLIHADAHLDQFFFTPGSDIVQIVDYDSFTYGDPMADVARTLSSIRSWIAMKNIQESVEKEIVSAFFNGYRSQRLETHTNPEFEQDRIAIYELRLYLIQLRSPVYDPIRNTLEKKVKEFSKYSEADFFKAYQKGEITNATLKKQGLTSEDLLELNMLNIVHQNATENIDYILNIENPSKKAE